MGLDANGVEFLFYAKSEAVDFTTTLTIGRQKVYVSFDEMKQLLARFGRQEDTQTVQRLSEGREGYCEPMLEYLGAEFAHSMDYSDYEYPTLTHDMNEPISEQLAAKYSVVLDGGSLEHVFNFPVAIKNCMRMVKTGGHYLAITPANNFLGHGFYQFSPELYFNVMSENNGFELQHMIAFEDGVANPQWYNVTRPTDVGGRVTLCNDRPVYLLIIAKKLAEKVIFATTPQQSDYTVVWGQATPKPQVEPAPIPPRPLAIRLSKYILPQSLRFTLRRILTPPKPAKPVFGFDEKFFKPLPPRHA